ncbi:MAG: fibronectin type III domain-containing protein, partial [Candidatus Aminicenantes bacterium]|nr:fibronectin type III domain-containing protein [Candidatus Aminicenantes bacterium]
MKIKKNDRFRFFFILVFLFLSLTGRNLFGEQIPGSNYFPVEIPDYNGWVYSPITIYGAPADAIVERIDVSFSCTHSWGADLDIDLNDQGLTRNYNLWSNEAGVNPYKTVSNITTFNGLPVNGTWKLYAQDKFPGDEGKINWWSITIYYTSNAQTYSVNAIIYNLQYGTDMDNDDYYETFDFLIGVDGNVSPGSASIHAKLICNTTGQTWWSSSSWPISGTLVDYHYFPFDETNFSGNISGNTGLYFTVEIWDSTKTEKLAEDSYVSGEPVKADNYIPPDYNVYGIVDSLTYKDDVDEDNFYETFTFRIGVDGDVNPGSATIYAKIICNTTSQAWWSSLPWTISGTDIDYHYFAFDETFFSDYLSVNGNTDLDFTVEIWNADKSTLLSSKSYVQNEPVHADYFSGPPATVTVHGKMEYRDRYYNHHPIRYAEVKVFDGISPLGTTSTDGNGNYTIEVNNIDSGDGSGADIKVEVYSKGVGGAYPGTSSNFGIVKPGPEESDQPWSTFSEIKNDNLKPDLEINLTAETFGSDAGAFSVYDAIVEAFIKTFTIYSQEMPGIMVIWQEPPPELGGEGTCYDPNSGKIYLVMEDRWDRDVILHEYGHYIQDRFGFQNGLVGGDTDHAWDQDLTNYPVGRTDEEAKNLAFREAWPTFFSISVQYGDTGFPNSGDSIYQDTEDVNPPITDNLEQDTMFHFSPGEFYEAMNCCTLWDIFDSNNHFFDNNDTLSLDHDEIWNIVIAEKPNDIKGFWEKWFNHFPYKREMTRIFLDHRMSFIAQSPTNPSPPDGSINQPLSLTLDWSDATNATSYDVYLKTTGNFQHIGTTAISSYPLTNLVYYTDYRWQIIAKDGRAEAESPIWSFRTLMEHTVSTPNEPNGPSIGDKNISFNYSTGSGFCSYGHIVQYRFDWGDGTLSDWTTLNTASHSWSDYGTYSIKAQARCANDTSILSAFSAGESVTIEKPHVVITPIIPTGPENCPENITCDYFTGGSNCSYDHNVEYRFDWGDGTFSDWHNLAAASHAWIAPGTYTVRAQARCSVDTGKVSGFSQGFIINVTDTCTLSVQSGDITGIPLTVTPDDLNNSGDGNTTFNRIYTLGTEVTLTASPTYNDNNFIKWVINGVEYLNQTVQLTIDHDLTGIVYYYVPPEPEIKIKDGPLNGEEMANGSSYDFGNIKMGYYKQILWVIENEGIVDLELPGSSPIEIEGPDSDQFIVVQQPPSVLVPGDGQIFRIHFIPTSEGIKSAKISIVNNDTNENPYEINLSGAGIPEVGIQTIQREALIALYNSTNGDSWADNSGWKDGELEPDGFAIKGTEDTWYGVSCSYEGVVTSINLDNNNLVGTIPPEVGNIKDLGFVSLYNNHLTGNIPAELGNATNLWSLLISGNNLVGEIPVNLTNLTGLGQTNIGYNGLYTNDEDVRSFLNSKDPDWENTQTIASTGLNAVELSNYHITLEWNSILYTGQPGGYRVYHSTTSGGPYTFFASTGDKTVTSMQVTGLSPGTNYYFVVQTRTESSAYNSNVIDSEYSEELSASTTSAAAIHLISPNGGETWEVNSIHDITWTSYGLSGNIKIEYSPDNGNTWETITSSTENDGSYAWSIPYDASNQCKIRLGYGGTSFMDTSDNVFSIVLPIQLIVVTSPNGGETWYAGSTVDITWISHGPMGTLQLDYSTDNGSSWNLILYTNENDGSHPWTIPHVQSNQCLVRISQSGGVPLDTSDGAFTIINETPRITVTSPNGGDIWPARSYRYITWTSEYVSGNVKIEYTTNSGFTWKEIAASTENDGIHPWSVPHDPAQICYLRVSEIDGEPSAQSNYFTIDYPPSQQISEIERIALVDLYNSTNGDNWANNSGWKTPPLHSDGFAMPGTEYTWYGVIVVAYWDVERIELSDNNLAGIIPDSIGNLSKLNTLDLARNQITGAIPGSIGNLSNLLFLHLESNQLVGSIPPALGNLSNLSYLYLYDNQLTGTIPVELENLSNLRSLALHQNNLNGNIPLWMGNLSNLQGLFLFNNSFTGTIPPSLGNLSNLISLLMSDNNLSGSIPAELGNLSNLNSLSLQSNQLSGGIPVEFSNLTSLISLYLNDNSLSGNIPAELSYLSNLRELKLQSNKLSGNIPIALSNLTGLGELWTDIGYNALYTDNETLRIFLNEKDSDWENTQTIAPLNVTASPLSADSILLNWSPITYIQDPGGYSIYFSTTQGGPYTHYNTTIDKTVSSMTVTGLNPGTTYYFIVQGVTDPHANNQNEVISEDCPEVSAATLSLFYIQVTYPDGDESFEVGSLQNITWNTVGPVGDVNIEYSPDSGSTWTEIVVSTMNDGMHPWTIPDTVSAQCLIRISEIAGSLTDTSNQLFSIVPVPAITITSPTGGESFEVGSSHNITWSTIGDVSDVKIEYSTDNGSSWVDIVTSMANIGIYSWTIPDTISAECRIRISELDGNPASINNFAFSIVPQPSLSLSSPNGGESLEVRSKKGITWSTVGNISNVKLEFSTNSGSDWAEIMPSTENDGFNLWQIPDTVSSQCLLKISGTGGGPVDVSDAPFSIIPEPTISIVSPDGGELFEVDSTQNITWTSTGNVGNVKIEYSSDKGANWSEIISSTVNSGSYSWIIPDTVSSQ